MRFSLLTQLSTVILCVVVSTAASASPHGAAPTTSRPADPSTAHPAALEQFLDTARPVPKAYRQLFLHDRWFGNRWPGYGPSIATHEPTKTRLTIGSIHPLSLAEYRETSGSLRWDPSAEQLQQYGIHSLAQLHAAVQTTLRAALRSPIGDGTSDPGGKAKQILLALMRHPDLSLLYHYHHAVTRGLGQLEPRKLELLDADTDDSLALTDDGALLIDSGGEGHLPRLPELLHHRLEVPAVRNAMLAARVIQLANVDGDPGAASTLSRARAVLRHRYDEVLDLTRFLERPADHPDLQRLLASPKRTLTTSEEKIHDVDLDTMAGRGLVLGADMFEDWRAPHQKDVIQVRVNKHSPDALGKYPATMNDLEKRGLATRPAFDAMVRKALDRHTRAIIP